MNTLSLEVSGFREVAFLHRVYGWMAVALAISAIAAGLTAASPTISQAVLNPFVYLLLFVIEIGLIILLSAALPRLSQGMVVLGFLAFAIVNGISLSVILPVYSITSIASTFVVAAGMFAFMSIYGYITPRSLTTIGHLAIIGLVGVILALFVSVFWSNQPFNWAVTIIGILIFLILTAYDTQKLKNLAQRSDDGRQNQLAIRGALQLYLDILNLFLFLLRLGRGKKYITHID